MKPQTSHKTKLHEPQNKTRRGAGHTCPECGKSFRGPWGLVVHTGRMHRTGPPKRPYVKRKALSLNPAHNGHAITPAAANAGLIDQSIRRTLAEVFPWRLNHCPGCGMNLTWCSQSFEAHAKQSALPLVQLQESVLAQIAHLQAQLNELKDADHGSTYVNATNL